MVIGMQVDAVKINKKDKYFYQHQCFVFNLKKRKS